MRVFVTEFTRCEFHSGQRYYKVTQEGPRDQLFGFKDEVGVIEEAEVHREPEMVKKIEMREIV